MCDQGPSLIDCGRGCSTMIQIDLRVITSLVHAHSLNITHENVFQLVEVGSRCTIDTVASKLELDYYFVTTWGILYKISSQLSCSIALMISSQAPVRHMHADRA